MSSPFPGPTPPYNNPPIQPLNFQPRRFVISNIILGMTTAIFTILPMDFVIGQQVRLLIPRESGIIQLNGVSAYVVDIASPTEVILDLDTSLPNYNNFVNSGGKNKPQIIPIGDINSGIISVTGPIYLSTTIPGAFINIS